jgi:cytochrome P450/NADPH-cytochrome P450 reductase
VTITPEEIPGPRGLPLLGNVRDIDTGDPIGSLVRLAREYGSIYKISTPGGVRIIVSGADLVAEACDDERFDKKVAGGVSSLRSGSGSNGLFSSDTDDPMWKRAHNILMTPFSMMAMREYMPMMLDIAEQLIEKWERLNPDEDIDVPADMTRLTLDTIALCGFGYRFNSFYRDTPHPFVDAMIRTLDASQARLRQLPIQTKLNIRAQRQLAEDQDFINDLVDDVIRKRRAMGDEADNTDLLGAMLTGVDKQTGESLPDENIRAQCITFLIAGHETTSGLLSFAIYYLLKNPAMMARARAEVDEVLGSAAEPTFDQVNRLRFVRQVLDETLRLWPTAPAFTRQPYADTVIGGRFEIPAGQPLTILTPMLHRDPAVWGPDAEDFNPDHTAAEKLSSIPPNAYKPFGTGQRACIGRQFALQEATMVLGMVIQHFDLIDYDDYELHTKTTLTVKPEDFRIQVRPRPVTFEKVAAPAPATVAASSTVAATKPVLNRHGTPLSVLFGSNLGTAEGIASRLAQEGTERGYAVTLGALDEESLPKDGAAIIVCSSYNGLPTDNAVKFHHWLREAGTASDACAGLKYTIFGCGNTEWAATYQAIPTEFDTGLSAHGGTSIHPRGAGDARGDFDAAYRDWHDGLWAAVDTALGVETTAAPEDPAEPRLSITSVNRQVMNPVIMSYRAHPATVTGNRELLGTGATRSTRHVEIALPHGVSYRAGDHLGVLPRNDVDLIRRVMRHFLLDAGSYVTIIQNRGSHTHLPVDEPAPLLGILGSCVELQDPASRTAIEAMVRYTDDPEPKAALTSLVGADEQAHERYRTEVLGRGRSLLDLLEAYPACAMPFEVYLDLLQPLRPRYYSISSSPLAGANTCTITTGVLRVPARSGEGTFAGVCSNYLASSPENSTVFAFVHEPSIAFRPPENPHVPMIMVGAGTGLAPFRGFLQERAAMKAQGVPIARSLLFFGCRRSETDFLYSSELRDFERDGVVEVETVFSRQPIDGRTYVQHSIAARADDVWNLIGQQASIFVCGNANTMAPGVRAALVDIFRAKTGGSAAEGEAWLADLRAADRFLEDIWGG